MKKSAKHSMGMVRAGFTLIEVATSLSIVSVLILGLSGAVMISAHAIPSTADTGAVDQTTIRVLNQLRSSLREATTVKYRSTSGNVEIQLDINDAGAAGSPGRVIYTYSAANDTLSRQVDARAEGIVLSGVTTFAVALDQDGSNANGMYFMIYVEGTIQRFYEIHAALPYKPEVL